MNKNDQYTLICLNSKPIDLERGEQGRAQRKKLEGLGNIQCFQGDIKEIHKVARNLNGRPRVMAKIKEIMTAQNKKKPVKKSTQLSLFKGR